MPIRLWKEDDRPREKLLLKGKASLSDAELLAILIGSGTSKLNALDIARSVLLQFQNDLHHLAKANVSDLSRIPGIGKAKAIMLVSALEIGRRKAAEPSRKQEIIRSSEDVFEFMKPFLLDLKAEEFWVILLNRRNGILRKRKISSGGLTGTVVDPRLVFREAIEEYACAMILVHNHPSGNCKPSNEDIQLTKSLKEAGILLEIQVLDHVIFSNGSYFSFADEGMM